MSKAFYKIIIYLFILLIGMDFLMYQLKIQWPLSFWKRQWFMFSYSDDRLSQLLVTGKLKDGRKIVVPMNRWFNYFVGFETSRYNEISRRQKSMEALADYVCRQYNLEAKPSQKLVFVNISSVSWMKEKGVRFSFANVAKDNLRSYPHISNKVCH